MVVLAVLYKYRSIYLVNSKTLCCIRSLTLSLSSSLKPRYLLTFLMTCWEGISR